MKILEAEFQGQIIDLAHICHWYVAHFRPARTKYGWRTPVAADGAGWPDLIFARERLVFAEIKSVKGKVSPAQQIWLDVLRAAGCEVYAWWPTDADWEEIVKVLK